MNFRAAALIAAMVLLPACEGEGEERHERDYRRADKTPLGFHVEFEDLGTLSTGLLTKDVIFARFDESIVLAAFQLQDCYRVPYASVMAAPHDHKIVFRIVDHWHYWSPWNGWVSGEAFGKELVKVTFWKPGIPYESPYYPWTVGVDPRNGRTYYGLFPGAMADILRHELGHVFFGPGFEH